MLYRCYAKVNLTLEIVRKREDGFHELASLVHTIGLADDLRIDAADDLVTRVEGLDIDPDTNLVARAAQLISTTTRTRQGAELSLVKRIPAAAGLGGGSSDAATTLVGLNTLWDSRLGIKDLEGLAAEIGSDIPFFIRGGAALVQGRGEHITPLPALKNQWLVLIVPPHDVTDKTRRLYAALEQRDFSSGELTHRAADHLQSGGTLREADLRNGFERAARAVFPGQAEVWAEAERVAQRRFFLSGAGPALFALARDRADARRNAATLGKLDGIQAHAVRTIKHARVSTRARL